MIKLAYIKLYNKLQVRTMEKFLRKVNRMSERPKKLGSHLQTYGSNDTLDPNQHPGMTHVGTNMSLESKELLRTRQYTPQSQQPPV